MSRHEPVSQKASALVCSGHFPAHGAWRRLVERQSRSRAIPDSPVEKEIGNDRREYAGLRYQVAVQRQDHVKICDRLGSNQRIQAQLAELTEAESFVGPVFLVVDVNSERCAERAARVQCIELQKGELAGDAFRKRDVDNDFQFDAVLRCDVEEESVREVQAEAEIKLPSQIQAKRALHLESQTGDPEIQIECRPQYLGRRLAEREIPFDLEVPIFQVIGRHVGEADRFAVLGNTESDDVLQRKEAGLAILRRGLDHIPVSVGAQQQPGRHQQIEHQVGKDVLVGIAEVFSEILNVLDRVAEGADEICAQVFDETSAVRQAVSDKRQRDPEHLAVEHVLQSTEELIDPFDKQQDVVEETQIGKTIETEEIADINRVSFQIDRAQRIGKVGRRQGA